MRGSYPSKGASNCQDMDRQESSSQATATSDIGGPQIHLLWVLKSSKKTITVKC